MVVERWKWLAAVALTIVAGLIVVAAPAQSRVRTYYIAADDVRWNFAPSGQDLVAGKALPPRHPLQLGWVYHKAIYREYTDATFCHLKARGPHDAYLGLLGPVIRAEVGDTIVVRFKNNTRLHLSVHPHGVKYDKASEGAPYRDGSARREKSDDAVPPGGVHTYTWTVPERAAPGPMDPSSIVWMYHSHTDEVRDVDTGPIGPIIITRRGMARPDGSPKDVDVELVAMFSQMDESQSRMLTANLADPVTNPHHVAGSADKLQNANQFLTINGFDYGNLPMLTMTKGQRVRWYLLSSMDDNDFHAPTWHGQTVLYDGQRASTLMLGPMDMKVADMLPDNPGVWLFDCSLGVHLEAGMTARFAVLP
ncbi:MAG: copper oxidase [Candidatus Eremiobacter antarcticus]|nr:multicopper oxidase domain-containing protein [Candidatus Eremiobacteraeota bacterium]MBC5807222.1 multicopper oxidase domain-containing protein [Candidatus Eremiobacteraeota bacterium]PZR61905.1 MAG: copper oxidase [Candidatus Eremiobacter sp. RRmetagenome_bin22]